MSHTAQIVRGSIILAVFVALGTWVCIRSLKKTEDPALLIFKWVLTAGVLAVMIFYVGPMVPVNPLVGVPFAAVCGLALAIIWRRSIAMIVAKPFGALYDGGDDEIELKPYYSIALAQRKKGKYAEAASEVRKQLDKFPDDVEGQLMLAEIQAENLNDLAGAQVTIHRLCNQPNHNPRSIALAFHSLADWHLKLAQDREAAQQALEKIVELYPDSEFSTMAFQRIARLGTTEQLLAPHDRQRVHLSEGAKDIGLMRSSAHLIPVETDPAKLAVEHVKHLETHPLDTEAREQLAKIYAEHFQRADMAIDQFEQLVNCPNQPDKRIVRWLNSIVDLQIKYFSDADAAKATLQRIVEKFPNSAASETAQRRMELLKLNVKANATKDAVKMGVYEQDIGLKR